MGSLAGAAHLLNDNAGVPRSAQQEQKSCVDDKAKSFNASWELKEDYPETLEFNITRRK